LRVGLYLEGSAMTYHHLARSCDTGPCPTFYVDDTTGGVDVQGYRTTSRMDIPVREDVVHIPAQDWARLLADLPVRMLLRALIGIPARKRARTAALQGQ
jgi:hypothetical protein